MLSLRRAIQATLRPAAYHGQGQKTPFFEGWYCKVVDRPATTALAVIVGIYRGEPPARSLSFIQVLDARSHQLTLYEFPVEQFQASAEIFDVRVEGNRFSAESLTLNLPHLSGHLTFHHTQPWPVTPFAPGIMGWYAWMPFMECYHGVVSLDHSLQGTLTLRGEPIEFNGGRGYIEKDWGRRFPATWVWVQSNHFAEAGVSLTASTAMIPWLGRAFRGYIAGFQHAGVLHRFTTYNGSQTERLSVGERQIEWVMRNRSHRLALSITRAGGVHLYGPTPAGLAPLVEETIGADVVVQFSALGGAVIFEGRGQPAGLEVHGNVQQLLQLNE